MKRMNAKQIQELLDKFCIRSTDLASGAGVSEDAVRKWLAGKSKPNTNTQSRINEFVRRMEDERKEPAGAR